MYHNLEPLDDSDPLYSPGWTRRLPATDKIKRLLASNGVIFIGLLCLVAFAVIIGFTVQFNYMPSDDPHSAAIVNISCGQIQGLLEDGVFVFKGIPYAFSPEGKRRWQPPVPIGHTNCWGEQMYVADRYATPCFQYREDSNDYIGSEDCLYVNVWSPRIGHDANLDVMVFIHGGGLMTGSGHMPDASPNVNITRESNKVFVSFNYRLNAFGFMALDALSWASLDGVSGNYGLMDQIEALRWVQSNIAVFGGNPDKVTVFGVGSGSTCILVLLSLPQTVGLFHRAWLISPSPKMDAPLVDAQQDNFDFLNATGCLSESPSSTSALSCLYKMSPEEILEALPWQIWCNKHYSHLPRYDELSKPLAVVDGRLIPVSPQRAWLNGTMNDVPLLIGSTAQETDVMPPLTYTDMDWYDYDSYVRRKLDPFGAGISDEVLSLYPHSISVEHQLTSMVSDLRAVCPVSEVAQLAANRFHSPVHRYIVTYVANSTSDRGKHYAYHGVDIQAFFNGAQSDRFAKFVRSAVREFVETGSVRMWSRYPDYVALISTDVQLRKSYNREQCMFWRENGFFPEYAWMN